MSSNRDWNSEISTLREEGNMNYYHQYETSGWKSPFVKLWRKIMSPVLTPLYAKQNAYNQHVANEIEALVAEINYLRAVNEDQARINSELSDRTQKLETECAGLHSDCDFLRGEYVRLNGEISNLSANQSMCTREVASSLARYNSMDKRVTHLESVESVIATGVDVADSESFEAAVAAKDEEAYELDYLAFENAFRGDEADIKAKLTQYVPYFADKKNVYDLGCGRGEFLEILKENGIEATGVDMYPPFVEECQEKGLKIVEGDAVSFVSDLENDSADGFMLAQVAEHLPTEALIKLIFKSFDKLKTGGVMIMETPNPMCLSIYRNAFYLDPTHSTPVHPKYLEFLFRNAGFSDVKIVFTESSKIQYRLPLLDVSGCANLAEFNDGLNVLSDVLFGSQDYAVIAIK